VADELLQYIITQEHQGLSEQQIRQALQLQNYPKEQVDAAFKELHTSAFDPVITEYVMQYAKQGLPPVQIFNTLTAQGYAPGKVRKSIREVFGPGTMPVHHYGLVFLIVAVIIAAGLLFFNRDIIPNPVQTPQTIEVSLSDQLAQIITIARTQGKDAAVKECNLRLRSDSRDSCLMNVAILDNVNDDSLCEQIADVSIKDTCLMNFIDAKRESVCKRVTLRDNIETCQMLASLQKTPST
jgi:hypothetical protein